jgi:uncharacterized heparinase superfamily protein
MRIKQIWFQIYYRLRTPKYQDSNEIHIGKSLVLPELWLENNLLTIPDISRNQFSFLNRSHIFPKKIDWNWDGHGKLWTYQLNYFEPLSHPKTTAEAGLNLIEDYYSKRYDIRDGMEPYPISLRGFNWIKFFIRHNIHKYDNFLYDQYSLLRRSLEYHLLGNHLLENAISLAFAALYFDQKEWTSKTAKILQRELKEQILDDGGHFELSPMYHSIVLTRLADLYSLLLSNPEWAEDFRIIRNQLKSTLSVMASWLSTFKFSNGDLAWVNDSSISMMPASVDDILDYVNSLGIEFAIGALNNSGYRRINTVTYEMLIDVGAIGPEYLPGHAHADSLNFILNWKGEPLIVDTGISTYESNDNRRFERSTLAHNTISVGGQNSSDVWASFRVGRRAKTRIITETSDVISAIHSGFQHLGVKHSRTWKSEESTLTIKDELYGGVKKQSAQLYLHFACHLKPEIKNKQIVLSDIIIKFNSESEYDILKEEYEQAIEFNKVEKAQMVIVHFSGSIVTEFTMAS